MNRVHSMTVISILKVFQYTTCENVCYILPCFQTLSVLFVHSTMNDHLGHEHFDHDDHIKHDDKLDPPSPPQPYRFATLAKDIHHHSVFTEFMSNYITATHRYVTKLNNIK